MSALIRCRTWALLLLGLMTSSAWADLTLNPAALTVAVGASATATVSGADGPVSVESGDKGVATVSYANGVLTVTGVRIGNTMVSVRSGEDQTPLRVTVVARDTQAPTTPTSLTATSVNGSRIDLSWTASTDNIAVTGYRIERCTGRECTNFVQIATSAGTSYSNTGLTAATTYRYRVRAQDAAGNLSAYSNRARATTQATNDTQTPTTPSNLTAVAAGTSINLNWIASTDNVAVTGYRIERCTGAGCTSFVQIGTASGTSFADTGLTAATTYAYRVRASDAAGNLSGYSNTASATTSAVQASDNGIPFTGPGPSFVILAANDLGMHCTDQDFQVFSILPPFNTMHSQVIQKGATPILLDDSLTDVYYAAASSVLDPAGTNSINTTSTNSSSVYKTDFWQVSGNQTFGSLAYRPLYPALDNLTSISCDGVLCSSILDLFSPIPPDVGLPVPDPNLLFPASGNPALVANQQTMMSVQSLAPFSARPYQTNTPQRVKRFDANLPFFVNFPFGSTMQGVNWFSADGIPMVPTDDAGRANTYPLARVAAVAKGSSPLTAGNVRAALDIVLPVASEADCQSCHAALSDATQSPTPLNGRASDFASVTTYANGTPWRVATTADTDVPGPGKLLNAAKINILRLHDAKHGASYIRIDTEASDPCLSGTESSCLDQRRTIQCSQCHFTTSLDLMQVGPIDEPKAGRFGRQQTRHVAMTNIMHRFHGNLRDSTSGQYLFPDMPAPGSPGRTPATVLQTLGESCYQCHPGKRTQCLRGAMAGAGVACQDCHGNMRQIGNDFTSTFPSRPGSTDYSKRVGWVSEPKCQSCHIGDAVTFGTINTSDMIVASGGIRLAQAFTRTASTQAVLTNITSPNSRFAENNSLYRYSTGHGGVMCKACHGSTHAEWPVANPNANDNVAATQLQGHTGTITECSTCHTGTLPNNLNGPHGMHPVNSSSFWNGGHQGLVGNGNACRACHGLTGQGTVLSRTAANRTYGSRTVAKGTPITCTLCHGNQL